MLIRLKVSGFKNLVEVDVRFGPFTCIAGANGVGKSNLFDAIKFLSALADKPLLDAALSIRDEGGKTADIRSLFHRVGHEYAEKMSFEAEMIIAQNGVDDLGQEAVATTTLLRYQIDLAYHQENSRALGTLEILHEALTHIPIGEVNKYILFTYKPEWKKSVLQGRRTSHFISTTTDKEQNRIIKLHQDASKKRRGGGGRTSSRLAQNLPRTVLSVTNASEHPTALLARREMQSWRLLQLEPSALRKPDEFTAPSKLGTDGSHLAKTLYSLATVQEEREQQIYGQVAERIAELIEDAHAVKVERDDKRELLTVQIAGRDGTFHPARALSDGTLRFLALSVLELSAEEGLLCFEEPENGIHPQRIEAMLKLLQDIAMDIEEPVNSENPLRQVIINTHSPSVVSSILDESLLVAELKNAFSEKGKQSFKSTHFSCLPGTWRVKDDQTPTVIKGKLLTYLNPIVQDIKTQSEDNSIQQTKKLRVKDRADLQQLLLPGISK